jgi:hypothetical protein
MQNISLEEWVLSLYYAALFAWQKGNAVEADKMAVKVMETRTR